MSLLVSLMIPCYNAADTLPTALASVLAQSYTEWECIVVDDGSDDDPAGVVGQAQDERIRLIRLARNYGRGAARQIAVEQARGALLCKLDADDWLYPSKLAHQVEALEALPEVGVVSTGLAVMDGAYHLVGVRAKGPNGEYQVWPSLKGFRQAPLAYAPAMVRMAAARRAGYHRDLRRAEDADFLLRLLWQERVCVLPTITYAYSELAHATWSSVDSAYRGWLQVCRRYWRHYPLDTLREMAGALIKRGCYAVAFKVGMGEALVRRRSQPPMPDEVAEFMAAKQAVLAQREQVFGLTAPQDVPWPDALVPS